MRKIAKKKLPNFVIGLAYDLSWHTVYEGVFFPLTLTSLNTHTQAQNSVTAVNFTGSSVLLPQVHFTTSITLSSQTAFLGQRQQFYLTAAKSISRLHTTPPKDHFQLSTAVGSQLFLKTAL